MIISHQHRFVYFAMPKTGSTTFRGLLQQYNDVEVGTYLTRSDSRPYYQHMRPAELAAVWPDQFPSIAEYHLFTGVRNPWARLVSLYNHLLGTRRFTWERRVGLVGRDFDHWLTRISASGRGAGDHGNRYRMYGSYSVPAFCSDDEDQLMVDDLVPIERIDDELAELGARLGVELTVPKVLNTRPHAPYREYYSDRSRDIVAERYAWEIERFGYEF